MDQLVEWLMPFWDDWFKSGPDFKTGIIRKPTKFRMTCTTCSGEVRMSIPSGYQEPGILLECDCGKAEQLSVE